MFLLDLLVGAGRSRDDEPADRRSRIPARYFFGVAGAGTVWVCAAGRLDRSFDSDADRHIEASSTSRTKSEYRPDI
jgi:hypothetical protein